MPNDHGCHQQSRMPPPATSATASDNLSATCSRRELTPMNDDDNQRQLPRSTVAQVSPPSNRNLQPELPYAFVPGFGISIGALSIEYSSTALH